MTLEITIVYEGYIKLEEKDAQKLKQNEDFLLPSDVDYLTIEGISMEARERLNALKPKNLKEASRITNVHPSDLYVLLLYLKGKKN